MMIEELVNETMTDLVAHDPLSLGELMQQSAALICNPCISQACRKRQQRGDAE